MAVITSFYMFSRAFDLGSWLPAGGPPSSEQPRKKFTSGAVAPPSAEPAGRRSHTQQASVWPRHGQLSRESEIFVIVRVYVLPGDFTWPTRLPRHAACVSSQQSKPVRPRLGGWEGRAVREACKGKFQVPGSKFQASFKIQRKKIPSGFAARRRALGA